MAYGAGSTVYGYGSSAATSGTVDPMGYIERELDRRRQLYQGGADRQSDTRSGIAQAALGRITGANSGQQGQPNGNGVNPALAPKSLYGDFIPTVAANPSGKLQYPQLNLPFDPDIAAERVNALQQFNNRETELQAGLQRAAQERVTQSRDLEQRLPLDLMGILNQFAGRGMARSSGYGGSVMNEYQGAARQQQGIDTNYANADQGYKTGSADALTTFLGLLNNLASRHADRVDAATINPVEAPVAAPTSVAPTPAPEPTSPVAPAPIAQGGYGEGQTYIGADGNWYTIINGVPQLLSNSSAYDYLRTPRR